MPNNAKLLFADDLKTYTKINFIKHSIKLQQNLDNIASFCVLDPHEQVKSITS